ncbi:MAG TPA: hypothetical protein VFU88_08995 [Ktedonobacterales bacterium]|nr:hypothetical protein [Ktedonobacterales bacterium]
MRRRRALLPLLALGVLLALAGAGPVALAAPLRPLDDGAIAGVVVNGAHGNAPVSGLKVTLHALVLNRSQDAGTATTDAQGRFAFSGLDTSGKTTYEIAAPFDGGTFYSQALDLSNSVSLQATVTVFDTTTSDAALRVASATILLSQPKVAAGLIPVAELVTFDNTGATAYAGSLTPTNGKMSVVRFSLPDGATNLTLGAGFGEVQAAQVGTGFGAGATLPPGKSTFAFAFDAPYTGTGYAFTYKAEYPLDKLVLLAPTGMRVNAPGFDARPTITANGQQLQLWEVSGLTASATATFRLTGLAEAGVDPTLPFGPLLALGLALAALLALLLVVFLRRGSLDFAASQPARGQRRRARTSAKARAEAVGTTAHKRLLQALLDLDARHTAGKLDDATYRRERTALHTSLRDLLAAETPAPAMDASPAPVIGDVGERASDPGVVARPASPAPVAEADAEATAGGGR